MQSFIELLKNQFEKNTSNPSVIYHDKIITFGQLEKKTKKVAVLLQAKGLREGDRVALYTSEKFPFLVIHLGIILSGGVSVPLNHDFTRDEMLYFLNDSGARFAFASRKEMPILREIQDECSALEECIEHGKYDAFDDTGKQYMDVTINADDPCFILYSSGTTGRPKGVVHTHRNVALSLLSLQKYWGFTEEDILLNVLPLYHLHGLSFAAHLSLISGSRMILEDTFLYALDKIKDATVFMAVPTIYYAFLRRKKEFKERATQWKRTRLFTCGSAPIRPEILPELEEIIKSNIVNRYGMTESHVITSLPLGGPFKRGSVGLPIGGIDMKLLKVEDDEVGEVMVRSKNLFSHYWNKLEATKEAFDEDGFFYTGDLGRLDDDGFLTLLGRKDDLIIVDGENVYPPVVERVLNGHGQIQESAVIGIPDSRRGEQVVAVIVSKGALDIEELRRYCIERLASYQQPTRFEIVKELPRNTMSKVLKRTLRERFSI